MTSQTRIVSPEILDRLPPLSASARQSRRDLRLLNRLMGSARICATVLRRAFTSQGPRQWMELGAGDGAFALRLAEHCRWSEPTGNVYLVDRLEAAEVEFAKRLQRVGWRVCFQTSDVFDWLGSSYSFKADLIVANLFLHHFPNDRLRELLRLVASRTSLFVACEPRRSLGPKIASRLVGLLGCNYVTRHDAAVSVRAGFSGGELSALWPRPGWEIQEGAAGLFSWLFVARAATSEPSSALSSPRGNESQAD